MIKRTLLNEKGPTASPPVVWATNATPQMIAVIASNIELRNCLFFIKYRNYPAAVFLNLYTFRIDLRKLCVLGFCGWLNI